MEEITLQQNALSVAQKNMLEYFSTHDVKFLTEDAVFKNLNTGEVYTGRAEVGGMLHYIYHVAFDAKAELKSFAITEEKAVIEGLFVGKHIGEFAGIPATNKNVNVPLCVTYDLQDGLIKEARIYLLAHVMMRQLGVNTVPPVPKTTYLVRDIFQLKFGHYRDVKKLLDEAFESKLMPEAKVQRIFTDFTGDAYRLVLEEGFDSLNEYETSLTRGMATTGFQEWYNQFKQHVESSHREILKQIF
ncbi:MAG TPA: ester cyclase [Flavisolibacter sp.]|nr:ester cyclase [Flavisolibacter sp.]